jgi:hypothetical protein
VIGRSAVTGENALAIAAAIEKAFHLRPLDGVVVVQRADNGWTLPNGTFEALLSRHEQCMGLAPMKIFLSHKGVDKEMVRRFEKLLRALGFDPWLDDDAMPAGSSRTALSSRALRIRARRYFLSRHNLRTSVG